MNIYLEGIDAGENLDATINPLAFVNCSESEFETNMVALQFENNIFYMYELYLCALLYVIIKGL